MAARPAAAADAEQAAADARALGVLWQALTAEDYEKAREAARALAGRGDQAVAFLRQWLKPASAEPNRVRKLIGDLGSESYPVRAGAAAELAHMGSVAVPALREALEQAADVEARRRIQALLDAAAKPVHATAAGRRILWAIRALEAVDTAEAHELLRALAGGDSRAELTQQAKAALERLAGLDAAIKNPPAGVLELRLLPQPAGPGIPDPTVKPQELQQYVKSLAEKGPQAAVGEGNGLRWLEVGCMPPATPFTATHKGRPYILLGNRWPYMAPTDFVRRDMPWELLKARVGKDQSGLAAVEFELNAQVRTHLRLIPQSGQTAQVAVVVGEEVVSIVASSEELTARGRITGLFSQRRARGIAAALRAGMPPIRTLLAASMNGELEQAKEVLADWPELVGVRGRQVPFKDDQPLHAAVRGNQKEIVELLLARGAKINALGSRGETALQMAVSKGRLDLVRLLLAKGADMRVADRQGLTALHAAVGRGNKELAQVLIAAGADVNAEGKAGMTPLAYAVTGWLGAGKDNPCMELLLAKGAKLDIFTAAALGKLDQVQAFLKADPDAARAAALGRFTPLHLAALAGHAHVAGALLDSGADVNAGRREWVAPLTLAAGSGRTEIVKLLLERKADVNAVDADGGKPIHAAACQGRGEIVKILLAHGVKADEKDASGATPLFYASKAAQREVVSLLLDRGADPKATRKNGRTVLQDLAELSVQPHGIGSPEARKKLRATVQLLIARGAQVGPGADKNTPLHLAVKSDFRKPADTDLIRLFLKSGAEVNAKNRQGRTPLHFAAKSGDAAAAKVLLAAGADPFLEDHPNSVFAVRPVDEAKKWGDRTKAVKELLEKHMAVQLEATKKAVEAVAWEFLLAVVSNDLKTIQKVAQDPPHMAKGIWPKWAQELRAEYAGQFDRLTSIAASHARAGWAEAFVEAPLAAKHKYLVVFLMRFPDGKWRVLETSKTSQDLPQALGQRIRYARMQYQRWRNAIFDAAGMLKDMQVSDAHSSGLPMTTGRIAVTVRDGRLRMETSEKRRWLTWAMEVHETFVKIWAGGGLSCARQATCKSKTGSVTLVAENGKATWREGGRQLVMVARDGKVQVEVKDAKDAAARTITAAKVTVEWGGGLRLTSAGRESATPPAKAAP